MFQCFYFQIRIIDYGFVQELDQNIGDESRDGYCSLEFAAPEMMKNAYKKVAPLDVWSFGFLVQKFLTKSTIFGEMERAGLYDQIVQPQDNINAAITHLVFESDGGWIPGSNHKQMFMQFICQSDPDSRPDITEVLAHPFWNQFDNVQRAKEGLEAKVQEYRNLSKR